MKKYLFYIPWFPISVIAFYTIVIFGSQYTWIPSIFDMIDWLSDLYKTYGLPALFISSFLESIAYIGLYFPGSIVILLAVAVSDGSVLQFMTIAAVTALAIVCGSIISYYSGLYGSIKTKKQIDQDGLPDSKSTFWWFIICNWHPNAIGLWFFKRGVDKKPLFPWILYVWPVMFIWGLFLAFVVYTLRDQVEDSKTTEVFTVLIIWLVIDVYLKYKKNV